MLSYGQNLNRVDTNYQDINILRCQHIKNIRFKILYESNNPLTRYLLE